MKKNITAMLFAVYLLTGCSSGGGTSGADGIGGTTGGGLLLTASLSPSGSFTVTIIDISDLTGGLFPAGAFLESYTVTYVAPSAENAPALSPRAFGQTTPVPIGTTVIAVILSDARTLAEFTAFNPNPGISKTYTVTVNYVGRTLSGERISVAAATVLTLPVAEEAAAIVPT